MKEQQNKVPVIKIAYHKLIEEPTVQNPGAWKLELEHKICFSPGGKVPGQVNKGDEDDEDKDKDKSGVTVLQTKAATLLPAQTWENHLTKVLFSV